MVVMRRLALRLKEKLYRLEDDPYYKFHNTVKDRLQPHYSILDAGCGRDAGLLGLYAPSVRMAVGMDQSVETKPANGSRLLVASDLSAIPLRDSCFELIYSRSVFEHIENPELVCRELWRVLKPGGELIFLTPNAYDYATVVAKLVPNRLHKKVVNATEGRAEDDTFPTFYRANSGRTLRRLASRTGFTVVEIRYLSVYPGYLLFHVVPFTIGVCLEKLVSRFEILGPLRRWLLVRLQKPSQN